LDIFLSTMHIIPITTVATLLNLAKVKIQSRVLKELDPQDIRDRRLSHYLCNGQ